MTVNRSDFDEPRRLELDSLAPRQGWVARLPSLAREAALRREGRASWGSGLAATARWILPLAAGVAIACWLAPTRMASPSQTRAALLLAGSAQEALVTMTLEGSR